MEFVLWVNMNERQHSSRLALLTLCIGVTSMSIVLNIHRCTCVSVLLARGHKFKHGITSHPRYFHMILIFESPHKDSDVVEFVTVYACKNYPFVYHLLDICTLVSADESLSAECKIQFRRRWKVPLSRLGSLCMEQVCAERALEKSPYIAVRNIRGMDVFLLQLFIHILQHHLIIFGSTVVGYLVIQWVSMSCFKRRSDKGILLRTL